MDRWDSRAVSAHNTARRDAAWQHKATDSTSTISSTSQSVIFEPRRGALFPPLDRGEPLSVVNTKQVFGHIADSFSAVAMAPTAESSSQTMPPNSARFADGTVLAYL
jgi:hypothetical protein